jgi:hypothetical protein
MAYATRHSFRLGVLYPSPFLLPNKFSEETMNKELLRMLQVEIRRHGLDGFVDEPPSGGAR